MAKKKAEEDKFGGYEIMSNNTIGGLITEVNDMMELGWEPTGGVFLVKSDERLGDVSFYMQAVVIKGTI